MIPYPHQSQAIQELREGVATHPGEPGLLVAPTGSGKSEMFGWMARAAVSKGRRVGAVVNRRILVKDLCKRVERQGLDYGIIMGNSPRKAWAKVHVASFDTLWRRPSLPAWDLVFIDECHFSLADKYSTVITRLLEAGASIIGMTATPIRGTGQGLGSIYKWMVRCPDTPDLISQGYLVQPRVFAPSSPDLKKVEVVAGEFNQRQLATVCNSAKLTGDILTHWLKNGRGNPTIGFGVDIKHCQDMAEMFCGAGVRAVAVDHTYKGDFDLVWSKLSSYETEVVFNVGIAGYGWDCPRVSHMIEARPTMSPGLWLQHCGRVMRTSPGKEYAIINDHAGNSLRHGLPDEYRDWQLHGDAIKRGEKGLSVSTCKRPVLVDGVMRLPCYATFKTGPKSCPYCGLPMLAAARKIEQVAGDLQEVVAPPAPVRRENERIVRAVYESLRKEQVEKGYKDKYARMRLKAQYGVWAPKSWDAESAEKVSV